MKDSIDVIEKFKKSLVVKHGRPQTRQVVMISKALGQGRKLRDHRLPEWFDSFDLGLVLSNALYNAYEAGLAKGRAEKHR